MTNLQAIDLLKGLEQSLDDYCELNDEGKTAFRMAIEALSCSEFPNNSDTISRQAAIDKFIDGLEEIFSDIRERHVDDSVCGLCEYDGAYIGQSGDWCNECPGFDRDDCFKLSDKTRKKWTDEIIKALPSVQPDIIRCKDCDYCDSDVVDVPYGITKKVWWCDRFYAGANENLIVEPDDFCSFAKRRE